MVRKCVNTHNFKRKGFTLLEILLVVAIISILAGIVIIAINPAKQLGATRDAERKQMIAEVNKAMVQFYIDKAFYPASTTVSGSAALTTTLTEVCDTGSTAGPQDTVTCTGLVDLSELVPTYLSAIPKDPQGALAYLPFINMAHAATGGSGYSVAKNIKNNIYAEAKKTEGTTLITLGSSVGVDGAGTTVIPSTACTATGGTITTNGSREVHTFTSGGTFTVTSGSCSAQILIVAGGGGGQGFAGGGGGGGGVIVLTSTLTSGSYTVTVGDGGTNGNNQLNSIGGAGGNSSFDSSIAIGGGGGASYQSSTPAGSGGSGGGGGGWDSGLTVAGSGTSGQGYAGGTNGSHSAFPYPSGGGGGAGGAGGTASVYNVSANGGIGISNDFQTGSSQQYGGGGGGGMYSNMSSSAPGTGSYGGGNGGNDLSDATSGTAHTGGGGGGSGAYRNGGDGGSGIVIVSI